MCGGKKTGEGTTLEELPFIRDCYAYSFEFIGTKGVCIPNRRIEWNHFLDKLRELIDGNKIFYVKLKNPDDFEQEWDSMVFNEYFQRFQFEQFEKDIFNSKKLFYPSLIQFDYDMEHRLSCNLSFEIHGLFDIDCNIEILSENTNHE